MLKSLATTTLSTLIWVSAALAGEVTPVSGSDMGCAVAYSGLVEDGDAAKVAAALDAVESSFELTPIGRRLCLDSPGGSLLEAAQIGDEVSRRGFGTAVPAQARCKSACAVIFMAGRWAHPESDGGYRPDRVLHPKARLGFHAPSLDVPDRDYSRAELDKAYAIALSSMGEIVNLRARWDLTFADSLLLAILGTPPSSMTYVETVGQAARWQIDVAPVALPDTDLGPTLTYACLNADGGMLDTAPSDSFYNGKSLDFLFGGFGEGRAEVRTLDGFRAEAAASCQMYVNLPEHGASSMGLVQMIGGAANEQTDRVLYSYGFYPPETPIASLPVPAAGSDDGARAFLDRINGAARASLANVTFESCWVTSPRAKVVNVENFVNLRQGAGFDGQVIAELPLGETLRVMGTQQLHMPGNPARARECLDACNGLAMTPYDEGLRGQVASCIDRNVFWYEVQDTRGKLGFVSRKYLSD